MANQTNPSTDVLELLNHLKKTFEDTFHDVSSAKGVENMIDHLKKQVPLTGQCKHDVSNLFSELDRYGKIKPSDFYSIRVEIDRINGVLREAAAKADKDDFPRLSETELKIIDEAGKHPVVKCLRASHEFSFRLDEFKHDPRICLFLAIFPNNVVLRKRLLIYWWIGEGFVSNEEEGERVFEELLDLELLLPYRADWRPRVSKCKILPWIRCLLISEAKKEMLLNTDNGIPHFDLTHSRCTCLIAGFTNLGRIIESEPETLRTIFNVNERYVDFQDPWLAKMKRLVVLQLGRWQVSPTRHIEVRDESFLTGLKPQKYLKYLSLRGISRITSLPDSIGELVSLEILDLKACHNIEALPVAIASLKKLTHLDVSECYLLERLPKELEHLSSLQVFKGFIIGNLDKTLIRIVNLQKLTNLKRLSIHIGSEATIQKDEFKKLEDLKKVKCLKISWGEADVGSLSFPPGLQKLDLEGFPHETKPEWLEPSKLSNLEMLNIKGGKLRNLFDGGEQWNVKYLVLKYTNMPPIDRETLNSMFPLLQYVKKVECGQNGEREVQCEWIKA